MAIVNQLPLPKKKNIRIIKIVIALLLALAITICIYNNKQEVMALVGENYADSLPIYSVDTEEKVVGITFDAACADCSLRKL